MGAIQELRDAFVKELRLDGSEDWRPDRWVAAVTEAFRRVGTGRGLEVAPLRRGVGELGWELVWGRNLVAPYARLGATNPRELFALELVLEVAEGTFRPGARPESAVEEAASDLAKLLWARAPLKVLVFGARRESEPASSLEALAAGLGSVIEARDRDSDYLLVGFPNLLGAGTVAPGQMELWTRCWERGRADAAVVGRIP